MIPKENFETHILMINGFQKSFEEIQPTHTLWLDIEKSEEEILAQMKEKGRYNINLARKKGVEVAESNDIETFYGLHQKSAARDGFKTHSLSYFKDLFIMIKKNDLGGLLIGSYQGQPL